MEGAVKIKPSSLIEAMFGVLSFESALVKEWCDGKAGGNYSCMVMVIRQ